MVNVRHPSPGGVTHCQQRRADPLWLCVFCRRKPMFKADADEDGVVTQGEFLLAMDSKGLCCA